MKRLAAQHVEELERKIEEMEAMRKTLRHLIHCCHGDDRPDCPILDDLEGALNGKAAARRVA